MSTPTKNDINHRLTFQVLPSSILFAIGVSAMLLVTPLHAVKVGPQARPAKPTMVDVEEQPKFLKTRMHIPSLRLAIPVLDPGIPISTEEQQKEGIWPELRQAEAVLAASKLKEWVHRFNQFDEIVISADSSISADLYLLGRIEKSDGETMELAYQIVDARGKNWTTERNKSHRVEPGWHERFGRTEKDPFDELYYEIAEDLYEELKDRGKSHVNQMEYNERQGVKSARMSELEQITTVRKLAFAGYISPSKYGDFLTISDGRYKIVNAPSEESQDWVRMKSIMRRDKEFIGVIDSYYEGYVDQLAKDYKQWQHDSFPVAREVRIAKRNRNLKSIAGAALLIASAAALKDGAAAEGDGSAELGVQVGAAASGALLLGAFRDNQLRKQASEEINELGKSMHNSIRPTRIDLDGKVVTLTGTVHEQYQEWSSLLLDLYNSVENDPDAVQILAE